MNKIKIKSINILYDDEYQYKISDIIKIIELNFLMFKGFCGKTLVFKKQPFDCTDDEFLVEDFSCFFDKVLDQFLVNNQKDLANDNYLSLLYCEFLAVNSLDENFKKEFNFSENNLYLILAIFYFKDKASLSNFLKWRVDKEKLFNWLQENYRFSSYNYFLNLLSCKIKEDDPEFWKYFDIILKKIIKSTVCKPTLDDIDIEDNFLLPKMEIQQIEDLFLEFLKSVDAPVEWYKFYFELKTEGNISYGKKPSMCYLDVDGKLKIDIEYNGTIDSFISLVHEFVHYISLRKGNPPISLVEFPSIFFELLALDYLKEKKVNENIIKKIANERKINNFWIYGSLFNLLEDINELNNKGPITREQKITKIMEQNRMLQQSLLNFAGTNVDAFSSIFEIINQDLSEIGNHVDKVCDESIKIVFSNSSGIIGGFQYVVGTYLAQLVYEMPRSFIVPKMFEVTSDLVNYNICSLLKILGTEEELKKFLK